MKKDKDANEFSDFANRDSAYEGPVRVRAKEFGRKKKRRAKRKPKR